MTWKKNTDFIHKVAIALGKPQMSQINAQIDLETTDKLAYIQQLTNQALSDILRAAIDDYYQKLKHGKKKTPFEVLEESGFIGCCSVESDLSINYKEVLATELETKYGNR
ncbi:CopG family transcriptional regulator [Tumidithrix elongata RA019]|uniref:CopG family transcriptional regulator n=1 Tax=Tumidithrix elongata BACA0141 TaxID=2716417 RepID=A0AAW9PZI9_9CYAN|nr:CopG family transcriptional regulator [Tumidithrix elongata RA019]